MHEYSGVDRRLQSGRPLSIIVDIGLMCVSSLGARSARLLYLAHEVPSTVASRVLFHASERRANALGQILGSLGSCASAGKIREESTPCQSAPNDDKKYAAALCGAFRAMMLTHGCRVELDAGFGTLNFEWEMSLLREALELISIDPDGLPEW
jgi:hypothetical protein